MATYKNTQGENILKGSEFKINVSMDPIDDYTMKDIIFKCTFFSGDKSITLDKDDMIFADDNNYVAPLDSSKLGLGAIKVKYEADIPDEDFPDGYRHEIAIINTGLNIVQPWAV